MPLLAARARSTRNFTETPAEPESRKTAPPRTRRPKVSIHLPVCNMPPETVRQSLDALALLDYPDFEVLVVDHNTAAPALWEPVAEHCARLGPRFRFFHLGSWPGFRAGALAFALKEAVPEAEIIGVLEAACIVSPSWLRTMVPLFTDPSLGLARSQQNCCGNNETLFKRLIFQECSRPFGSGAMTLVRAAAIRAAGGWAEWCAAEESELALRLVRAGWRSIHVQESFGTGPMPEDFAAWRRQRFRLAYGAAGIVRAYLPVLLFPCTGDLSGGQRRRFLSGMLPWLGDGLGLIFLLLGLALSLGLVLAPTWTSVPIRSVALLLLGLFALKLAELLVVSSGATHGRGAAKRAGAAAARLALSHTIGKAVLLGLLARRPSQFHGGLRDEIGLLGLTSAAMIGIGLRYGLAGPGAQLWCLALFTQSLPALAAIALAHLAAQPGSRHAALPPLLPAGVLPPNPRR